MIVVRRLCVRRENAVCAPSERCVCAVRTLCVRRERAVNTLQQLLPRRRNVMGAIKRTQ